MMLRLAARVALAVLASHPLAAGVPDGTACAEAIDATERRWSERGAPLPPRLLASIAAVESGRRDPATGRTGPWPWTIDVGGIGYSFAAKAQAIAAVRAFQTVGIASIDVGCMQVNLAWHPDAFASLDEAFAPGRNVAYGADFLMALHGRSGDWGAAIAGYHSQTPALGAAYRDRVLARWSPPPGLVTPPAPPDPASANRTQRYADLLRDLAQDHRRNLAATLAPLLSIGAARRHAFVTGQPAGERGLP